ncbi:MAG: hypothetical protein ACKV22_19620 [Bryobacteraceae bacterium]
MRRGAFRDQRSAFEAARSAYRQDSGKQAEIAGFPAFSPRCHLPSHWTTGPITYRTPGATEAGREFVIGGDKKLKSTRDLNGDTLTIAADGVTSSAGNVRIAFTRDPQGRISKITDPLGKEYLYGYNGRESFRR